MKKLKPFPVILLGLTFLVASSILIGKSVESSNQFKKDKSEIIKILNFNDRLLSFRDWVFSEAAWQEKKEKFENVVVNADEHYKSALNYGYYLLVLCVVFVGIVILLARSRFYFALTFSLSLVGVSLLVQGVLNPILEIAAFKEDLTIKVYVKPSDIPYFEDALEYISDLSEFTKDVVKYIEYVPYVGSSISESANGLIDEGSTYLKMDNDVEIGFDKVFPGYTYFYYQNKGIFDVIKLLWTSGNKPIAIAISVFSILLPIIKISFTLFLLFFPGKNSIKGRKILSHIAKWSMADVFVVGAFLSYLSFSNMSPGVQMEANVLFGLYYFGAYVLISIVLGTLLNQSIAEAQKKEAIQ